MTEPQRVDGPQPPARRLTLEELARSKGLKPVESIDDLDRVEDSRFSEGVFQEKDIVLLIFDNQQRFVHKRGVSNFLTVRHTTGPWKIGWH